MAYKDVAAYIILRLLNCGSSRRMPEGVNLWKWPVQILSSAQAIFMPKRRIMDSICYGCIVGFHEECISTKPYPTDDRWAICCCWANTPTNQTVPEGTVFKRQPKDADDIRDQTSTGRKRAVVAMAEWGRGKDGSVCEWAYLRNAGGGAIPIVGCSGTIIREVKRTETLPEGESPKHVHHGPDKSTLNNNYENLHAVCSGCHSRWHSLNDPLYGERPDHGASFVAVGRETLPHDADTKASEREVEFSDKFWSLTPAQRKPIQFRVMLEMLGKKDEQLNDAR